MTRNDTMTETRPLLSKWWMTESAKRAIARAADRKKEHLQNLRDTIANKRARIAREAMEWKPVEA